jgi:hypothetical protein
MALPKSRGGEKTLPLTVKNTGFLLDRLGEDCHPLQFLRELTQNAIEAINRAGERDGQVVWDVDWTQADFAERRVHKLCIIDNGDGMTGDEMVRYINQLSSSLSEQSVTGNFGVGAKIAAATRNHLGLIYLSWKAGKGYVIHLWRDPETGQYGLRQLERPDGTFGHYAEVDDSVKPDIIKEHGTKIVLMGNSEHADTMTAPDGAASPSRWIARYLNTRYFRIPKHVTIRAREGWEHPRADKDRNLLRRVAGQEEYLNSHAATQGVVDLEGGRAHWWIIKDAKTAGQNSGFVESSGHIAALYKDELFELLGSRAGRARLQQFGVLFGSERVVIYVEPDVTSERRLTTNTARTSLLLDSEPLPWAEWAAEFRENMPEAIVKLMEEVSSSSGVTDHSKSIRDRLKAIMDLYKVSRYRLTTTGKLAVDPDSPTSGGLPAKGEPAAQGGTQRTGGKKGGTAGGVYGNFLKNDGERGEEVHPDPFPTTKWISVLDGTRTIGDLEDRAARYLPEQNVLLINADFRVFTDMADRWHREFGKQAGTKEVCQDVVRTWFEQVLVETILGVQALKGAREWTAEDMAKALSEEGLTAAVMPRYHVNTSIKRELSSRLGKVASVA